MALVPVVGGTVAPGVDASGTPNLTLSESAPATVLYGTNASVSLTASNPGGGGWGYNLSYEDVLPAGVSYVSGSTTPSSVGDPQILANEPATHDTTLIWSNVSDLSSGSSNTLGFSLAAATDADPTPNCLRQHECPGGPPVLHRWDPEQLHGLGDGQRDHHALAPRHHPDPGW
jgi:uncharacterized repeat protein (TIGR01451 family)